MRLHNRQIKGSFWSDPDLIYELNRDQRMFFIGLTQLAEDSGCLEYDPRSFKIILYPADNDINPEVLTEWTEKIIKMGKLIVYEVEGKKYLYIKNFPKHQSLRTPAPPEIPLPIWICWKPREGSSRYGMYVYESSNNYVATPTYPCSNSNIPIKEENRIEENRIEENITNSAETANPSGNEISSNDENYSNKDQDFEIIVKSLYHKLKDIGIKKSSNWYNQQIGIAKNLLLKYPVDEICSLINWAFTDSFYRKSFNSLAQFENALQAMKGGADNGRTRTSQKPDRRPLTAEDYDEPEYRPLIEASNRKLEREGVFKVPPGDQELP